MNETRQHYNVTLAVLATAALAYALLQTMVAPALPAIQRDLGASTTTVTWVLTVYLLTASVATPIVGRLGDIYGKERVLVLTLSVFALGSLIAALSHSLGPLVAGPGGGGIGGARLPPAFRGFPPQFPPGEGGRGGGGISAPLGVRRGAGRGPA